MGWRSRRRTPEAAQRRAGLERVRRLVRAQREAARARPSRIGQVVVSGTQRPTLGHPEPPRR